MSLDQPPASASQESTPETAGKASDPAAMASDTAARASASKASASRGSAATPSASKASAALPASNASAAPPASKAHDNRPSLAEMAPLASTGLRFAARVVDAIVLGLLWVVALLVTGQLQYAMDHDGTYQEVPLVVAAALTFACYFVYEGAMLAHSGQTLGKKAVGIRVAVLSDGNIPGRRGWTRAAVYALPGIVSPVLVGWLFWLVNSLWCLWDQPYRQALHDKPAKTVVVRT